MRREKTREVDWWYYEKINNKRKQDIKRRNKS